MFETWFSNQAICLNCSVCLCLSVSQSVSQSFCLKWLSVSPSVCRFIHTFFYQSFSQSVIFDLSLTHVIRQSIDH